MYKKHPRSRVIDFAQMFDSRQSHFEKINEELFEKVMSAKPPGKRKKEEESPQRKSKAGGAKGSKIIKMKGNAKKKTTGLIKRDLINGG